MPRARSASSLALRCSMSELDSSILRLPDETRSGAACPRFCAAPEARICSGTTEYGGSVEWTTRCRDTFSLRSVVFHHIFFAGHRGSPDLYPLAVRLDTGARC